MSFYNRFDISIDSEEARSRFVNRVFNEIFSQLSNDFWIDKLDEFNEELIYQFGIRRDEYEDVEDLINEDFHSCLQALEIFYSVVHKQTQSDGPYEDLSIRVKAKLEDSINKFLTNSEVDLGISWEKGKFLRRGAKLLDVGLVNEPLKWLRKKEYITVIEPFEKGLNHFLMGEKKPQLLSDVITDMYEALEALAKIVTGRAEKDLSSNQEMFISKLAVSEKYKEILRKYVDYANEFRHAAKLREPRPKVSLWEVESFIYLTGLFVRLAIESSQDV